MADKEVLEHLKPQADRYSYISSMCVAPNLRRKGLASSLISAVELQAVEWAAAGTKDLCLHVYQDNQPAVKLYQVSFYSNNAGSGRRGGLQTHFDWKHLLHALAISM